MNDMYVEDWGRVRERFIKWWAREPLDYPLMKIIARGKPHDKSRLARVEAYADAADMYTNTEKMIANFRNSCETHYFLEDSFPSFSMNFGPGSLALYVGSEPVFTHDTVWFTETMKDIDDQAALRYDPDNRWWAKHRGMFVKAMELAGGDFLVDIPDIVENIDILAALRGPQNLCYDLMDEPESVKKALSRLNAIYFNYYDAIYDIVKEPDGSSAYTAFAIWGPGKTAKVQCDFNVMMSPAQFREFVLPGLQEQCGKLDNCIFHLDGPDAIKHAPAIMEIENLNALQWTCGEGNPDAGSERWFSLYETVLDAGKNLWLMIYDGGPEDWAKSAARLVKRYGPDKFFLRLPTFETKTEAYRFIETVKEASA